MTIVPIKLGVQSNPGRRDNSARLINGYVEDAGEEARGRYRVYAAEGLKLFSTLAGGGEERGMQVLDNLLYTVSGRSLFRVDSGGASALIGGIPGDGPVYMARNRKKPNAQIAIVAGGLKYILEGGTLTAISDTDLPAPIGVEFVDGYFVFPIADGRFFISAIDEGTSVDALDFAEAEGNPDGLLGSKVRGRELWLFGPESTEVWSTDAGDTNFPFGRLPGAFIDKGCLSGASIALIDTQLMWVANDGTVRLATEYAGKVVSSHRVEDDIAAVTDKASIRAFTYTIRKHQFYVVSDGANWTHVYDLSLGAWHERQSCGLNFWRASGAVDFANKVITGDYASGLLYEIDRDTGDENGDPLVWTLRSPAVHGYPHKVGIGAFFVDIEAGVGRNTTAAADENPELMMRFSKDDGRTWSRERKRALGRLGEYSTRVRFPALGLASSKGFVVELSASANVVRGVLGAAADVEKHDA